MTQIILRENTVDEEILKECQSYAKKCNPLKTDIWLDIGAHIGCFTCLIAPKVNRVIAYEPESKNYAELLENIDVNKLKNVTAINSAVVGNDDVERDFYVYTTNNTGIHSFFKRSDIKDLIPPDCEKPSFVKCENINDIIDAFGVTAIKMDCEGAEVEILRSLTKLSQIRELILEYHPTLASDGKNGNKTLDELIQLLRDNFILFKVEKKEDIAIIHGRQ